MRTLVRACPLLVVPLLLMGCGETDATGPDPAASFELPVLLAPDTEPATLVWDLNADWSDTENPNGPWSVNGDDTPLVWLADLSTTGIDTWPAPQPGFAGHPIHGGLTPVWFKAQSVIANGDPDWEVGDVVTHTSRSFEPNSNVTWTSPVDAIVDISGNVWATREFGRTNDWFLFLNDDLLTSGTVSSGDPFDRDDPMLLSEGSAGAPPLQSVAVSAGDVVELEFQQKFGGGEDYVGVNLTITVVSPTSKDDCKKGGWAAFGFGNQGQCVRFVETGKDSR